MLSRRIITPPPSKGTFSVKWIYEFKKKYFALKRRIKCAPITTRSSPSSIVNHPGWDLVFLKELIWDSWSAISQSTKKKVQSTGSLRKKQIVSVRKREKKEEKRIRLRQKGVYIIQYIIKQTWDTNIIYHFSCQIPFDRA